MTSSTQNTHSPLCNSSVWLSMNALALEQKTVCVEKSEVYEAKQKDKLGIEVVEPNLRDADVLGGCMHCSTSDVYRKVSCEGYFSKLLS